MDCYQFGVLAHNEKDYYHTVIWMQQALDMLNLGEDNSTASKTEVLDYLSYAMYNVSMTHCTR